MANVSIGPNGFWPYSIRVRVGDDVEWVNNDRVVHSIVFSGSSHDGNTNIQPGTTYERTFDTVGFFYYHDGYYLEYAGIIEVIEGTP